MAWLLRKITMISLESYTTLNAGETLQCLRKEHLDMTLEELAKHLGKSTSLVHQIEKGTRTIQAEDLKKFCQLFKAEDQRPIYQSLVKKTILKISESYGDVLQDKGEFLSEKAIQVIKRDFDNSRVTYKQIGNELDISGPQVKKMLSGEMACNRRQLLGIATALNADPEIYLFAGHQLTDTMYDFIMDTPEIFELLAIYKKTPDKDVFSRAIGQVIRSIMEKNF
jgi:transcriptional regulator with XRE-family HTH domain